MKLTTPSSVPARRTAGVVVASALVGATMLLPTPGVAQSARDIVTRMMDEYESRTEGIDNYTVVQEVMGMQTESYFEKQTKNGRPVFRMVRTTANGVGVDSPSDVGIDSWFAMSDEMAERAEYEGRETVNDYDVHVLSIPDLSDTGFGGGMPDADFRPTSGRLYVDVDTYMPRRMSFDGEMTNAQGTTEVTSTMDMGDYRDVEGMLMPWAIDVQIEGLGAAIDPETREQFERMQEELKNMPEAQRAMVERMMAEQMAQFEAMMSDDAAPMTMRVLVTEVRVNAGPPR